MGKLKMQNEVREKVGISPRSEGSAQKPSNEGQTSRVQLRALPYAEQVQRLASEENAAPVGGGTLDETTVERWIQSALNLLLGAGLNVDGVLSSSRAQIRAFQTKAPELTGTKLAVDGLAGLRTIGALEDATGEFAQKVSEFLDGSKSAGLARLVSQTEKASTGGGDVAAVKGRTTLHRGKTLNQMALDEKGNPRLAPGASVHVKLHWEGDNPYEFKDDFHHWMVYAGNGKLSDTLTGKDKSGSSMDAAMKGWVRKSFKMADYAFMHADPRFSEEKKNGVPIPKKDLQPLVSAEYDPRMTVAKKGGS